VFPTNFALGVLEADHIRVTVDGVVDGLGDPVEYAFTYNAATGDVAVLDDLTSGQTGVIQRIVPLDELVADFEAGADVSKRNLVRATKQTLMAVQEAADGREADNILITETVNTINEIADGIADNVAQTTADRIAAEAAKIAAEGSAGTATVQAALATTARIEAEEAVASVNLPLIAGNATSYLRANGTGTALQYRTPTEVRADIGINGIGSNALTAITNLNTLTVAGEYFANPGATGAPNGTDSFSIKHYASNAVDFAFQEAFSYTSGARWWRREMSDVWQAWVQVQGAIGFTPVEQGGGAGMGNDKIRIGWDGGSFRGNVNGTDVGRIIRNEAIQDTFNGTLNATGAPPLYACRAWVNFNGTNGSIRASGNVSSVVRNGVGDYTINFATAMPDANYAVAGFANYGPSAATWGILTAGNGYAPLAGSVRIRTGDSATGVGQDAQFVNVVIFR
jgi:hypothetical protein